MKKTTIVASVFLLLTSCASLTATTYQRPDLDMPFFWREGAGATTARPSDGQASLSDDKWWEQFADAKLNRLVETAMPVNLDLAQAALTLRQARLRADVAAADLWPTLSADGGFDANHRYGSEGGSDKSFSAGIGISYEADLFGRLSSARNAAVWRAEATAFDLEATRLSLQATLVSQYFRLAALREESRLSASSIDYARKTLALARAQYAAGAVGRLETLEAERSLASQLASHESIRQNEMSIRQTLALLFGQAPEQVRLEEPGDIRRAAIPEITPGLPADILARRPDLAAAETRLRAALADADSARISLYPRLTLTGSFGGSNEELSRALADPIASFGAGLILPFVDWRRLRRNVAISETEYHLAIIDFRQSLYQALSEVETCLSAAEKLKNQGEQTETMLDAARRGEALYAIQYRAGATPLQSWLDAQERRRQAETSLIENKLARLINQVDMAKALGGGKAR